MSSTTNLPSVTLPTPTPTPTPDPPTTTTTSTTSTPTGDDTTSTTSTTDTTTSGTDTSTSSTTSTTSTGTSETLTTLTESSTMVTSSASVITSNGQSFTTYIQVTTVVGSGTVVSTTATPTGAKQGSNTGAIVGGVVGGVGGLLLLALLFWYLVRRRRKAEFDEHFDGNFDPDHVSAAATGVNQFTPPPTHSQAHHRNNSSLEAGRQRVDLNDHSPQMTMASLGTGSASYPPAPYAPSTTTATTYAPGSSSAGYPASSASPPPSMAHHLPQMSMSSQGHNFVGGQYNNYGAPDNGAGYSGAGYNGPYSQGASTAMNAAPLGAAAYYGQNEKQILSPPGQEASHHQPQHGQYYPGGFGVQHQQGHYDPHAVPSSPTHTTNTSISGSGYNPYLHGPLRAMDPEPARSEVTTSSGAGLAYAQSHTTGSGTGSQAPMMSAKEREARGKGGPHVMNPNPEDDAGPSGPVVQHRDGGRIAEEDEEEGRGQSEIPPAYDSIVKGT